MPYKISDNGLCVHKLNADNSMGDVVKCHKTHAEAVAHERALMMNVPEAKELIHYRQKAITDAPMLRGEDERNCNNCKYFQSLPETHIAEEVGDVAEQLSAPSDFVEPSSGRGICTQFQFETDIEWVCDSWEEVPMPDVTMPDAMAKESSLMVHKEGEQYRWTLTSSSAYQDREREIVSQAALDADAARMTASGNYGTLDWYHLYSHGGRWIAGKELTPAQVLEAKPLRLGACDFSAMHGRIAIESGTFDNPDIGEMFLANAKEFGVSRSFFHAPNEPDAEGVYHSIQTFSRSLLPRGKESNLLTMLFGNKEKPTMNADRIMELVKKFGGTDKAAGAVEQVLKEAEKGQTVAEIAGIKHAETATEVKTETPAAVAPPATEETPWFMSDMKPEEFDKHLDAAVTRNVTPIIEALGARIAEIGAAQGVAMKEANAALLAEIVKAKETIAAQDARLKEIEGMKPRGYRASQDPATAADPVKVKELKPQADKSLASWLTSPITQQPPA
jgi:hypothetical protein